MGNLVRSVRETRVPTVAAYHRSRSRYQVSKLGGRLHREAEEILRAVDGAREVARELLARIVESLSQILVQVGQINRPVDGEALAGAVTGIFNDHHMFTESVTDFYAYLASVLTRYDLAGEEYAQFKALLLDYVDLISADVNRNAPEILERLRVLLEADRSGAGEPSRRTGARHGALRRGAAARPYPVGLGTARCLVRGR